MTNFFVVCHAGCCDDSVTAGHGQGDTPEVVLDDSRTPVSGQEASRVKASLPARRGRQGRQPALAPAEARGYGLRQGVGRSRRGGH